MGAIRFSETSVNTISTQPHIPEDCFLHSHRRENLKFFAFAHVYTPEYEEVVFRMLFVLWVHLSF
jgi:hypothetical protein